MAVSTFVASEGQGVAHGSGIARRLSGILVDDQGSATSSSTPSDRSARTIAERPLRLPVKEPTSFGTDALNGISVTTTEGNFYRLDPRS